MLLQKVAVSSAALAAALAFQGCVGSNKDPTNQDCQMSTEEQCTTSEKCYWFDKQTIELNENLIKRIFQIDQTTKLVHILVFIFDTFLV